MFYVGSLHEKEIGQKSYNWRFQICMCTHDDNFFVKIQIPFGILRGGMEMGYKVFIL